MIEDKDFPHGLNSTWFEKDDFDENVVNTIGCLMLLKWKMGRVAKLLSFDFTKPNG